MAFVKIIRNEINPPSDEIISAALTECGCTPGTITRVTSPKPAYAKADYTGTLGESPLRNALIKRVPGAGTKSWAFEWG